MNVVAIVQARMGSTRLPGKVMIELAGEPMLVRCVNRTRRAQVLDEVVVATTTLAADDAIARLCDQHGWPCFRGAQDDVLDRYYQAAKAHQADIVVRITSDCPLIDPEIVCQVVDQFLALGHKADYAYNVLPHGEDPRGLDVEVLRFEVLEQIWRIDDNPARREHVTAYISQHPELFRSHPVVVDLPPIRWTVDTPEDLQLVSNIYEHFGHDLFTSQQVLSALEDNPNWVELNLHVQQKTL